MLSPCTPDDPVNSCYVCSGAKMTVHIDVKKSTLQDLIGKVIKGKMGFCEPSLILGEGILYEEGEDADEDLQMNLQKFLEQVIFFS